MGELIDVTASGHYTGDCRDLLAQLPEACVQTCITSPPYWALRDYGHDGQIGHEPTPDAYVAALVEVFRGVRRALRDDGTLWLNLGDSYASSAGGYDESGSVGATSTAVSRKTRAAVVAHRGRKPPSGLKPKDLIGIPWLTAFALRADGWVLRSEIIWSKLNPMPESVTDRPTNAHEQIFLFSKAKWSGPEPGRFAHVSDADARWLALLIDTEGSIVVKRNRHDGRGDTFAPQVSIGNTSEALMREVQRIAGHGSLLERPGKNCRMLYWQVANGIAADFLRRLYPFLIVKQRQARIGIYVDSLTYYRGGQRPERKQRSDSELRQLESLWSRNKQCNHFESPDLSDVPEPEFGRWVPDRYHYNAAAIAEPYTAGTIARMSGPLEQPHNGRRAALGNHQGTLNVNGGLDPNGTRNRRSVWTVASQPYSGAHFATFPPKLIEPCVLAGSRPGDLVLDPFFGSGTTGAVAEKHGRRWVGFDLNPKYAELAKERTAQRSLPIASP